MYHVELMELQLDLLVLKKEGKLLSCLKAKVQTYFAVCCDICCNRRGFEFKASPSYICERTVDGYLFLCAMVFYTNNK